MKQSETHILTPAELHLLQASKGQHLCCDAVDEWSDQIGSAQIGELVFIVNSQGRKHCDLISRAMLPHLPDIPRLSVKRSAAKVFDWYEKTLKRCRPVHDLFGYQQEADTITICKVLVDDLRWTQPPDERDSEIEFRVHIHKGVVFYMVSGKIIACLAQDSHIGFLECRCFDKRSIKNLLKPRSIEGQYMIDDEKLIAWKRALKSPEDLLDG